MTEKMTAQAYLIEWPRHFEDIGGDALVMLNRLCSFCRRQAKENAKDNLAFVIGASEHDMTRHKGSEFKMVYVTAKKMGGCKTCMVFTRGSKLKDGRRVQGCHVEPAPKTAPHIHIMVLGNHAATHAQTVVTYLNRQGGSQGKLARKKPLKHHDDIVNCRGYIEGQSTHLRKIGRIED